MRRLRSGQSKTSSSLSCLLSKKGFGHSNARGSSCAGLGSARIPCRPEPQASRHLWVSGSRKIIRLWRTATQAVEPQLVTAKALIVNYTFGTGTGFCIPLFRPHRHPWISERAVASRTSGLLFPQRGRGSRGGQGGVEQADRRVSGLG